MIFLWIIRILRKIDKLLDVLREILTNLSNKNYQKFDEKYIKQEDYDKDNSLLKRKQKQIKSPILNINDTIFDTKYILIWIIINKFLIRK